MTVCWYQIGDNKKNTTNSKKSFLSLHSVTFELQICKIWTWTNASVIYSTFYLHEKRHFEKNAFEKSNYENCNKYRYTPHKRHCSDCENMPPNVLCSLELPSPICDPLLLDLLGLMTPKLLFVDSALSDKIILPLSLGPSNPVTVHCLQNAAAYKVGFSTKPCHDLCQLCSSNVEAWNGRCNSSINTELAHKHTLWASSPDDWVDALICILGFALWEPFQQIGICLSIIYSLQKYKWQDQHGRLGKKGCLKEDWQDTHCKVKFTANPFCLSSAAINFTHSVSWHTWQIRLPNAQFKESMFVMHHLESETPQPSSDSSSSWQTEDLSFFSDFVSLV